MPYIGIIMIIVGLVLLALYAYANHQKKKSQGRGFTKEEAQAFADMIDGFDGAMIMSKAAKPDTLLDKDGKVVWTSGPYITKDDKA